MRDQGVNGPGWLALGCMGFLVGIAVACGGETPLSPSTVTEVGSPLETSSNFQSLEVGSSTLVNAREHDGGNGKGGGRTREKERRLQYCKGLQQGHENYERCQTWLKSGRGNGSKGRAGEKERKLQYCKSLQQGHEHYERCQAWLNPEQSRRGQRQK
jgi:hypothetical protein